MEDNEKCSVTSTIEHSCIGTVINGDVEMQCPVFTAGACPQAAPPESLEEMREERAINRELLHRARVWRSVRPLLAVTFTLLAVLWFPRLGAALNVAVEWEVGALIICAVPVAVWVMTPRWLKEQHRAAIGMVTEITPELSSLERRIAYLEARERRRIRQRVE